MVRAVGTFSTQLASLVPPTAYGAVFQRLVEESARFVVSPLLPPGDNDGPRCARQAHRVVSVYSHGGTQPFDEDGPGSRRHEIPNVELEFLGMSTDSDALINSIQPSRKRVDLMLGGQNKTNPLRAAYVVAHSVFRLLL